MLGCLSISCLIAGSLYFAVFKFTELWTKPPTSLFSLCFKEDSVSTGVHLHPIIHVRYVQFVEINSSLEILRLQVFPKLPTGDEFCT